MRCYTNFSFFLDAGTGKELVRYRLALVPKWTAPTQSRTDLRGSSEIATPETGEQLETSLRLVFRRRHDAPSGGKTSA